MPAPAHDPDGFGVPDGAEVGVFDDVGVPVGALADGGGVDEGAPVGEDDGDALPDGDGTGVVEWCG
jgi:hypothetical protein